MYMGLHITKPGHHPKTMVLSFSTMLLSPCSLCCRSPQIHPHAHMAIFQFFKTEKRKVIASPIKHFHTSSYSVILDLVMAYLCPMTPTYKHHNKYKCEYEDHEQDLPLSGLWLEMKT